MTYHLFYICCWSVICAKTPISWSWNPACQKLLESSYVPAHCEHLDSRYITACRELLASRCVLLAKGSPRIGAYLLAESSWQAGMYLLTWSSWRAGMLPACWKPLASRKHLLAKGLPVSRCLPACRELSAGRYVIAYWELSLGEQGCTCSLRALGEQVCYLLPGIPYSFASRTHLLAKGLLVSRCLPACRELSASRYIPACQDSGDLWFESTWLINRFTAMKPPRVDIRSASASWH
jgi:hypothetical protein